MAFGNFFSQDTMGSPQRASQHHFACLGSQSQCRIWYILQSSGASQETIIVIGEFKHDVYGRPQTAKIISDFVFFSCNPQINHTKIEKCLLLFTANTNILILLYRAEDRRQKFHFCRLPFAVNVMLNLSNTLRGITLVRRPIWQIHPLTLIISCHITAPISQN